MPADDASGRSASRRSSRILYWLAVTTVSIVLVLGLLLLLQSCDEATVDALVVAPR